MMSVQPVPATREATAHHEGGHIVLGLATGVLKLDGPVTYTADRAAEVPFIVDPAWVAAQSGKTPEAVMACVNRVRAVTAAAGIEAEKRYLQEAGQDMDERQLFFGAHGDVQEVKELFGEGQFTAFRDEAQVFLTKQGVWEAVNAVAQLLLETWPDDVPEAAIEQAVRARVSTNHRIAVD